MTKYIVFSGPFHIFDDAEYDTDVESRLLDLADEGTYATAIVYEEGADGSVIGFSMNRPVIGLATPEDYK
jgi:hypothetical protein